jgi:hypothetical protein
MAMPQRDDVAVTMRQLLIDVPALAALLERVGTALESVGAAIEADETGEVALLVNRMAGDVEPRVGKFPGFHVERWHRLSPERRHVIAEGWIDTCVTEDRVLRVELCAEDDEWAGLLSVEKAG